MTKQEDAKTERMNALWVKYTELDALLAVRRAGKRGEEAAVLQLSRAFPGLRQDAILACVYAGHTEFANALLSEYNQSGLPLDGELFRAFVRVACVAGGFTAINDLSQRMGDHVLRIDMLWTVAESAGVLLLPPTASNVAEIWRAVHDRNGS